MAHAIQHKRTFKNDASKLAMHILPILGDLRLCDVGTRDIELLLGLLKKKLSPATVNRIRALLSVLFNLAIAWKVIDRNPCEGTRKLKENNQVERFLSIEEVRRILTAAKEEANIYAASAIQFLILTGVRREEALKARWEHIDLEKGLLFLPHTKSGRSRHVVLNDAALAVISSLPRVSESPWVFPGRDVMKPLNNPIKAFHRILKAAEVPKCRLHDCRHAHASMLVNQGASLYQVQILLGHASSATTQRYAHLASSTLRSTSQLVSDLVNKI